MQEEVTQKTMALAITTSRMTDSVLAKAMRKFLEAQKNKRHQLPKIKATSSPNHHALRRHCERKRISAIIRVETTT